MTHNYNYFSVYYTVYHSITLLYYFKFLQQKLLNVLPYKEEEEEWKMKIKSNRFRQKKRKSKKCYCITTTIYYYNLHWKCTIKNCKKQRSLCVLSWCLNTTITRDSILFMMGTLNKIQKITCLFSKNKPPNNKNMKILHTHTHPLSTSTLLMLEKNEKYDLAMRRHKKLKKDPFWDD